MTTHTLLPHSARSSGIVSIKTDPLYSSQMKDDQNIHYFHFINSVGIFFSLLRLIRFIMSKPFSVLKATQDDEVTWVQSVWETDQITVWIIWYISVAIIGSLGLAHQISSERTQRVLHQSSDEYLPGHSIHILLTNVCGEGNDINTIYCSQFLVDQKIIASGQLQLLSTST